MRDQQKEWGYPDLSGGYIASGYIETYFVEALQNFLSVAKVQLNLKLPLRIEAGLVDIKGYPIAIDNRGFRGKSLRSDVQWSAELVSETPAWQILGPFFDRIWTTCGIKRTTDRQTELAKYFEQNG